MSKNIVWGMQLLLALFAGISIDARAECYPSAAGAIASAQTAPCLTVSGLVNNSGQAVPFSATNPLPVTGAGLAVVGLGNANMAGSVPVTMASNQSSFPVSIATTGDLCQNPNVAKSSVAVNQGASATAKIVDTSGSKVVYVCSFAGSASGTAPTLTFKTGTHASADCDTSAASLTGAIVPAALTGTLNLGAGHTVMQGIIGGQLCLTTAATTSVQGVLTYVQQ